MTDGLRPVTPVGLVARELDRLAGVAREAQAAARSEGLARGDDAEVRETLARLEAGLADVTRLAGGLEPYLEAHTSAPSAALDELAEATRTHDWSGADGGEVVAVEAEMLSGHVEGELLAALVAVTGARRVLEIGMFTGYAALAMAQALPDDGVVVACELDPSVARFAAAHLAQAPGGERVDVRVGPAGDTLAALAAEGAEFDLVFLDADKGGYRAYVEALLDHGLLARDGLLLVDNTLLQGEPWAGDEVTGNGAAIRDFNAWLRDEPRVRQVLVPLRDGVTFVRWATEAAA